MDHHKDTTSSSAVVVWDRGKNFFTLLNDKENGYPTLSWEGKFPLLKTILSDTHSCPPKQRNV